MAQTLWSGYLFKLSVGYLYSEWQRRYFVLAVEESGPQLKWFVDETHANANNRLLLADIRIIDIDSQLRLKINDYILDTASGGQNRPEDHLNILLRLAIAIQERVINNTKNPPDNARDVLENFKKRYQELVAPLFAIPQPGPIVVKPTEEPGPDPGHGQVELRRGEESYKVFTSTYDLQEIANEFARELLKLHANNFLVFQDRSGNYVTTAKPNQTYTVTAVKCVCEGVEKVVRGKGVPLLEATAKMFDRNPEEYSICAENWLLIDGDAQSSALIYLIPKAEVCSVTIHHNGVQKEVRVGDQISIAEMKRIVLDFIGGSELIDSSSGICVEDNARLSSLFQPSIELTSVPHDQLKTLELSLPGRPKEALRVLPAKVKLLSFLESYVIRKNRISDAGVLLQDTFIAFIKDKKSSFSTKQGEFLSDYRPTFPCLISIKPMNRKESSSSDDE